MEDLRPDKKARTETITSREVTLKSHSRIISREITLTVKGYWQSRDSLDALSRDRSIRSLKMINDNDYEDEPNHNDNEDDFNDNGDEDDPNDNDNEDDPIIFTGIFQLPGLEELEIVNVKVGTLLLTSSDYPKLTKLHLENCESAKNSYLVRCPALKEVSLSNCSGANHDESDLASWVQELLNTAKSLETFDSYRLGGANYTFASDQLTTIRFHLPTELKSLKIWAPKLNKLDLEGARNLEKVEIWAPKLNKLDIEGARKLEKVEFLKKRPDGLCI